MIDLPTPSTEARRLAAIPTCTFRHNSIKDKACSSRHEERSKNHWLESLQ
jgi:hypothetical protein